MASVMKELMKKFIFFAENGKNKRHQILLIHKHLLPSKLIRMANFQIIYAPEIVTETQVGHNSKFPLN